MKAIKKFFSFLNYSCPTCDSHDTVESKTGGTCNTCKNSWQYGQPVIEDDSFVEDGMRW